MSEIKYICEGSCNGEATQEQFDQSDSGLNCSAEDCDKHGEPLKKVLNCEKCNSNFKESEEHTC